MSNLIDLFSGFRNFVASDENNQTLAMADTEFHKGDGVNPKSGTQTYYFAIFSMKTA